MGVSKVYLLLLLVELFCSPAVSYNNLWTRQTVENRDDCPPTRPFNLRDSFRANCTGMSELNSSICNQAWLAFSGAFARRIPTTIVESDYANYFQVLRIEVGHSQNLFWSGVEELVEMVSCMCATGANVVASTNTPSSAIINGIGKINWCGTTSSSSPDGIDYTNGCPCSVTTAFWSRFSTEFAQSAEGTTFYLGYGEKSGGTFQEKSFFSLNELPSLSPPRVSEVVVLVVTNLTGESCGNGTLVTLEKKVKARNLKFSCYDIFGDPRDASQVEQLSVCASKIVTAEQKGKRPAPDSCFSMFGGAGVSLPRTSTIIAMTGVALSLLNL